LSGELTIVGIGLIGGSFALAIRTRFDRILAIDPDDSHVEEALARGLVDGRVQSVPETTDAVLLACPSDRIAEWIERLAGHPATVFDTGSVKGAILTAVEGSLGSIPGNYVPTHPIAGLERSGPGAADPTLFRDRMVIATPTAATEPTRLDLVTGLWRAAGGRLVEMDAWEHDRVYARTSHLPHLLAFAYLESISEDDLAHTGGGFRDFSRIGASDPDMWAAIFDWNREALLEALDDFENDLAVLRAAIEDGDLDRCRALIARARARREAAP
jgi:3-phosphoshikimate 1-carboxyvinyltransferase